MTTRRSKNKAHLYVDVTKTCKSLLVKLADKLGTSQTAVIERAIRELAKREGVSE